MKRPATIKIDAEKLSAQIRLKGYDYTSASTALGHASNYISQIISRKTITKPAIKLIESELGIPFEDYMPKKEDKPEWTDHDVEMRKDEAIWQELTEIKQLLKELMEVWK